jgi:TnpA family transposase
MSTHHPNMQKIKPQRDDALRLIGSLKIGLISAVDIMRTLQVGGSQTSLAQAIAEIGHAEKVLAYADLHRR